MALPIRTKTNRANAQKSTGPKTDYGKSIAAQNSLKHGILSQRIIVGSESQDLFNAFSQDILEDFAPRSQVEREIVERIIYSMWKQRRLRNAETASAELAARPEVILKEMNISCINDYSDRFRLSDFSETTIRDYETIEKLLQKLLTVDYDQASKNVTLFEQNYSVFKTYLEIVAKKHRSDYNTIKYSPVRMVDLLEKLELEFRDILLNQNKAYRALQLKALMEQAHQIPRDAANQFLARYQVQLDNEIYKAMQMLRKHREWHMQFIETVEDVTDTDPESNTTDAANEDELEVA